MQARSASAFRWDEPPAWVFLTFMVLTGLLTFTQQQLYSDISVPGWVLAWSLVIIYALPVLLAVFAFDLFSRKHLTPLVAAMAWGAIAATSLAALANEGWTMALSRMTGPDVAAVWVAAVTAPWVEEALKLAGVVLIILMMRDRVSDLMDGFVLGAMCGLGFSIVEDVFYFMAVFGGEPAGVLQGFFVRVVANGLYGHLLYTGLGGMGVAYFATRRGRRSQARRVAVASSFIFLGVFAHFLWNTPWLDLFPTRPWSTVDLVILPIAVLVKAIPLVLFVGVLGILSARRRRRWVGILGDAQVPGGKFVAGLGSRVGARRAVREMRARAGDGAGQILRRLQGAMLRAAMLVDRGGLEGSGVEAAFEECASLDTALSAIPGAPSASG